MLGVLITMVVAKGCAGIGDALIRRWSGRLDPALRFGAAGLAGLGILGTLTLLVGLLPGGLHFGVYLVGLFALAGLFLITKEWIRPSGVGKWLSFQIPRGPQALALLLLIVVGPFSLVSVLAPSDAEDWDSLAYHLAVPKLWLQAGQIVKVTSLHQSNFPDVIDDLYTWGLTWGGESGAKAFALAFFLFGIVAVFGFARQRYGGNAGWWSAVAFATVPAIMWESGTAYIDVGHGLFAGLGIAFAALAVTPAGRVAVASRDAATSKDSPVPETEDEPRYSASREATATRPSGVIWLSAVFLGFATASKYTGLETVFVVALVLFTVLALKKQAAQGLKAAVLVGLVAIAIGSPWYVKNVVQMKNPVYPFLYERLGGENWDQRRADIYRNEQQSFGVGRTDKGRSPIQIGHAVLGLAYQPGRFVNPGQTAGLGTPAGAIGIVILAAVVLWPLSGRARRFENFILATSLLSFGMWFFLSQQSRYITTLAPPAAILAGGAVAALGVGRFLAGLTVLQACYSVWLFQTTRFSDQIQVVTGKVTADDYLTHRVPFYQASKEVNQDVKGGKVALYDEVFGYLLDVPYMWANPGHGTLIPYDGMSTADDYVNGLKSLGFTHVYISISPVVKDPEFAKRWLGSMGLVPGASLAPDERKTIFDNWETKWEVLLADAVAQGKLHPVWNNRNGVLFAL